MSILRLRPARRGLVVCLSTALLASSPGVLAQGLPGADALSEPEPDPIPAPRAEPEPEADAEAATDAAPATDTDADLAAAAIVEGAPEAEGAEEADERLVGHGLNLEGSVGLQNLAAAWGGTPGTYHVGLLAQYSSGNDAIRFNDDNTFFAGNLLFQATPIDHFSASLRLGTRNNVNSFGRPEAMLSQGDAALGIKGYFPLAQGLTLGGDLTLYAPSSFGDAGLDLSGTSVRPRLLTSIDGAELTDGEIRIKGHANIGYRFDNSENLVPDEIDATDVTRVERFAYGVSAYDMLELGFGFQYDLPYVSPFLAWNLGVPVNGDDSLCDTDFPCADDAGFASYPNVISLGVKAEPVEHLGLHAGLDLALTSDDARGLPTTLPYEVIFGLSWEIDPTPKIQLVERVVEKRVAAEEPEGFVLGTVVDAETGSPVEGAIIRYPVGGETPQATSQQGLFRSYGFGPGKTIQFEITHPDYAEAKVDQTIEEGDQELTVELQPIAKEATITGTIEDEAGEVPSDVTIKITGDETYTTTLTNGRFTQQLRPGSYTVAASAPGYMTRGRDVQVEPDRTLDLQLVLKKEAKEDLVELRDDKIEIRETVYFESGKEAILPRSFPLLDQVVSVLVENPSLKIRIEGHTDDVGGEESNMELSQQRANSVRDYLIEQGVSPDRLTAKGYGETRPILPNTSPRNRSINRRVEFQRVP